MSQPTAYERQYDFSDFQATNPSDPLPATQVDSEFDNVKITSDEILVNLALIQRDDGNLANSSVGPDQLSAAARALLAGTIVIRGAWATTTAYAVLDVVTDSNTAYLCTEAHTSGTLSTDITAGKWIVFGFEGAGAAVSALSALTPAADRLPYFTGSAAASLATFTAAARTLLDDATVGDMRTTLGLGALAVLASVNNDNWSGADLAVVNGGTGASSAAAARTNLSALENVLTTRGDLVRAGASGVAERVALGASGTVLTSDGTDAVWSTAGGLSRGGLVGLTTANNGTDADHDLDISVGACRDSADAVTITISSALTKQIDATWAAGDDAGGLSSSLTAPANNTWYHVFAIIVGGSADVGFDTSITAANLVSDHSATAYRRIGSVLTDGSANIIAFVQEGDEFLWAVPVEDLDSAAVGTTASLVTHTVPTGVKVNAIVDAYISHNAGHGVWISSPDQTDTAPSVSAVAGVTLAVSNGAQSNTIRRRTNTSAQLRYRGTATLNAVRSWTQGWADTRGRFA